VALALGTAAIVLLVLLWELVRPRLSAELAERRLRSAARRLRATETSYDPGRERRAEQRARALLRTCIDDEDWAMYRDLGFLRVWGAAGDQPLAGEAAAGAGHEGGRSPLEAPGADAAGGPEPGAPGAPYAYLIYPHRPIVAYLPATGALLNEYCVAFPDHSKPYGSARLPDSDDVLAKWMALNADERRLIADANMHLPGRQIDPDRVRRDLVRLTRWERERAARRPDSARAA
jgi:hypothetical protein